MFNYEYLVVGAGLFGSVFAYKARQAGKRVLIIDKRNQAGRRYCYQIKLLFQRAIRQIPDTSQAHWIAFNNCYSCSIELLPR
jgi:flavin-dependent dehydrogenase